MNSAPQHLDLDFDDPEQALGRWMSQLREPPSGWLTFDEWIGLYRVLASGGSDGRLRLSDEYRASATCLLVGVITPLTFANFIDQQDELWHQLLSAAAVDRSGVDWMGHLLLAALRGCPPVAEGLLNYHYLELREEQRLAELVWSRRPDDRESTYGDGWRFRRTTAEGLLREAGWSGKVRVDFAPTTDADGTSLSHVVDWIGWKGAALNPEEASDAALQSLTGDRAPLVCTVEGYVNHFLLMPSQIEPNSIRGIELVGGRSAILLRDFDTTSGWTFEWLPT